MSCLRPFRQTSIETLESRRLYTAVTVTGTSGNDHIYVQSDGTTVTVTMNGVNTYYTAVRSIAISGGNGDDIITVDNSSITVPCAISGNAGNDGITGGGGNDTITGNGGDDYIFAGNGDDVVYGNAGADEIYGGAGSDTVYATDASTNTDGSTDILHLQSIYGDAAQDHLHYDTTEDTLIVN